MKVTQGCLTVCNYTDYTIHGILQARILEWVPFPFSRGSSQPRDRIQVSCIAGRFFTSWATRPGVDCGSDHVIIIAKFRLKLKKVGETTRPFSSVQSHQTLCDPMDCSMPPCLSPAPGVYSNSCPLSQWCHPIISSFVIPFSPCPQSFWASGSWRDHLKNESVFHIRWPKYCSFSFNISPSNEHSGLISFRMVGTPCSPSGD